MKARLKAIERKTETQSRRNNAKLPIFIRHNRESDIFVMPSMVFTAIGIKPQKYPERYPIGYYPGGVFREPLQGYCIKKTDPIVRSINYTTQVVELHGLPDGVGISFWYDSMECTTNAE